MKLFLRTVLATVLLSLVISTGASADPPIKAPSPYGSFTFEGPTAVCSFPVQLDYTAASPFSITHLDKTGNVRWIGGAGRIVERFTNTLTSKSVEVNSSGPGKTTLNDDGSVTVVGEGPWVLGFFTTDTPSFKLELFRGHFVVNVAPDGTLTLVDYVGAPPQDICALIS